MAAQYAYIGSVAADTAFVLHMTLPPTLALTLTVTGPWREAYCQRVLMEIRSCWQQCPDVCSFLHTEPTIGCDWRTTHNSRAGL